MKKIIIMTALFCLLIFTVTSCVIGVPGGSGDNEGGSGDNEGGSGDNEGGSGDNEGGSGENEGGSGDNEGGSGDNEGGSGENEGDSGDNEGGSGDNEGDTGDNDGKDPEVDLPDLPDPSFNISLAGDADDSAITFEEMPEKQISISNRGNTYELITPENYSDGGVLHISKTLTSDGCTVFLYPCKVNDGATIAVFETDVLFENIGSTSQCEIGFANKRGAGMNDFACLILLGFRGTTNGSDITYTDYSNGASNSQGMNTGAKVGEWFNLRMEYCDGDLDTFTLRTYINDQLIYSSSAIYSQKICSGEVPLYQAEEINMLSFRMNMGLTCDMYLDNSYLEQVKVETREYEDDGDIEPGQTLIDSDSSVMITLAPNLNGIVGDINYIAGYLDHFILGDGGEIFLGNSDLSSAKEIIIGYVEGRQVCDRAYEELRKLDKPERISEFRYLLYAEGGKIVLAFDKNPYTSAQPTHRIVRDFVKYYLQNSDHLLFDCGVVFSGTVDMRAVQNEIDDKKSAEAWEAIKEQLGDVDVYESLRAYYDMIFDDNILSLVGSWYDPATGLFYASTSGKRAEGIYPIPEATSQATSYMKNSGAMSGDNYLLILPEVQRYKIIYYLKSIQGEDGEFYVPQLKKANIDSNRVGRDRSACISLLSRFKGSPTYDVGSTKGDGITAEEYWTSLLEAGLVTDEDKPIIYWADYRPEAVEDSLAQSVAVAVSHAVAASDVVAVASTSQFQSHVSFVEWLLSKDCYNGPYGAISSTSSAASIISDWSRKLGGYTGETVTITKSGRSYELKTGETLNEILINWMNSYINEAGLFGKVTNNYDSNGNPVYDGFFGGWGYQNSNGFFKGIGRYSSMGIAYPKPREAAESLLKGINSDEPATSNVLVIYNVWSSLGSIRSNVQRYYEGDDKQEILDMIEETVWSKIVDEKTGETRTYAALAIDKAIAKLQAFRKVDGGFGHSTTAGTSGWQGGLRVGIPSDNLSDMDAISCTNNGLTGSICSVLGISSASVPRNTEADLFLFLDAMHAQPSVTKTPPAAEKPKSPPPEIETFEKMPEWISLREAPDSTIEITELVGEAVLHVDKHTGFTSFTYNGINKKDENPTVTIIGLDILVKDVKTRGGIEIYPQRNGTSMFLPYLAISGTADGSAITVVDHSSGKGAVPSGITVGKWASVEIRYYGEEKKYDFYVNGKFVMSGNYLRSGTDYPTSEEINGVCVAMNSSNVAQFYYDNLYIYQLNESK